MLFELSQYTPAAGLPDKAALAFSRVRAIIDPHALGIWQPDAGSGIAPYVSLSAWHDFEHRETVHQALREDREWIESSASLTSCEHWIVAPSNVAPEQIGPTQTDEIYEFRIQEVANGSQAAAGQSFWDVISREIKRTGGRIIGQFDIVLGPNRPVFVTILAWSDYTALHSGWQYLDRSSECAAQRDSEMAELGRSYFDRPAQWLMRSMVK
ncbi:MAG: NIPSNAP family protein [Rhizobiaceae bacterium]|nr:NIPSNAP family protein [Rhizobiaceae bacterium]